MNTTEMNTILLYLVACDFHSGQNSRGYRLQCALKRRLRRRGWTALIPFFPTRRELGRELGGHYDRMAAAVGNRL